MRIIVSTIGTPTYGISQYLVNIIQPILNKNDTRLKNSSTFVNKARDWEISADEIQVSFDVVNLYPSIPLKEGTDIILDIITNDEELTQRTKLTIKEIKMLIELCLSKCYYLWNDTIYELEDSGPIGLAVVMAEAFLQVKEKQAINMALHSNPPVRLKSFVRYVDDSHARFPHLDEALLFKNILNQQHPNIQYTIECEDENKTLNFLDIKIINDNSGKYKFNIHRKNAITNIQVKPTSNHDPKILNGIFKGFVHRAFTLCSETYIDQELQFLVAMFVENGYEKQHLKKLITEIKQRRTQTNDKPATDEQHTITLPWIPKLSPKLRKHFKRAGYKTVFKSNANLKTILSSRNKSSLPKNSQPLNVVKALFHVYEGSISSPLIFWLQQKEKIVWSWD